MGGGVKPSRAGQGEGRDRRAGQGRAWRDREGQGRAGQGGAGRQCPHVPGLRVDEAQVLEGGVDVGHQVRHLTVQGQRATAVVQVFKEGCTHTNIHITVTCNTLGGTG